jgi:amidohydrolase
MVNTLEKQINLRHRLHRDAELSGHEERTARIIEEFLSDQKPDEIVPGLGGNGLAAVFSGKRNGPRVLLRCELDALPIAETSNLPYCSRTDGISHKCGHDGHMAILAGAAVRLGRKRPERGGVIILFQPAEETGQGALQVVRDPGFARLAPDHAFALHNLPGYPAGQVLWRKGPFASASTGFVANLTGVESHAGEPERGRSPATAMAEVITALDLLPQPETAPHDYAKVTVIHAQLGERAFGTSPGKATIMATLRAGNGAALEVLESRASECVEDIAGAHGLASDCSLVEEFPPTVNHDAEVERVVAAAGTLRLNCRELPEALAWSEDFGHYLETIPGALFGVGAGIDHPALHSPEYDFPDAIIQDATDLFVQIARDLTG